MELSARSVRVELPASTHYLVLVRQFISSLANHIGFSKADVAKIELALDEACSNSIRAIRRTEGETPITRLLLDVEYDCRSIAITVHDNGWDFSKNFQNETPLQDLIASMKTSGYGLQIIKTCMDEVIYNHIPERGNLLRLVKYVEPTPHGT
ncbi:MAG TPA: ATP-binding protein [bacterium]|nr:ATP-binding protein [bacterium]HPO07702.1 ATP-binding protein [bacterium]HQO34794.1 ATP-binding protein [bacterium]HQP98143.1 ATP-binding protein [bacterium]